MTDFSGCPLPAPPVKSHQHSLGVSRGSAHQNQERNAGSGDGSTQVVPFFQRDPRRLPRDHRAPRKPAVGASVRLTTGSSFRATPTYPLAAAMYFLDLAHRTDCHLHAHTRCRCVHIRTNAPVSLRGWVLTRTEVTVTRADIVKSDVHKGIFLTLFRRKWQPATSSTCFYHMEWDVSDFWHVARACTRIHNFHDVFKVVQRCGTGQKCVTDVGLHILSLYAG